MTSRYDDRLLERGLQVTPGGSQTLSKRAGAFPGGYPHYIARGEGPYVWDVDGRRYLDLIGGLGATPFGHRHPYVDEAIERQLKDGILFGLPHRLEVDLAERLCAVIPCAESVRFVKTGSEACAGAIRIARMATGRSFVLMADNGYHGWHDWYAVTKPQHPGVPPWLSNTVGTFPYGDPHALRSVLTVAAAEGLHVAAVILEPALMAEPPSGYLAEVVRLSHEFGALAIFDEMILGGRVALAGGQELYGVTPDLATFGKAFANGLPLAFIAGRRDLMQHAWPVSGTFGGECLSLAACWAVLDLWGEADSRPSELFARLTRALHHLPPDVTLGGRIAGPPLVGLSGRPVFGFGDLADPIVESLAALGILMHPSGAVNWNVGIEEAHAASIASALGRLWTRGSRLSWSGIARDLAPTRPTP